VKRITAERQENAKQDRAFMANVRQQCVVGGVQLQHLWTLGVRADDVHHFVERQIAPMDEIKTKRLVMRPLRMEDAGDLFAIRGDPEAMRYWDWPADQDVRSTREVIRGLLKEIEAGQSLYMTARLATGGFVGVLHLSNLVPPSVDLGFVIVRPPWGQGLGCEGVRAIVGEAERLRLLVLTARIHIGNDASRRLLLRLGFQLDGPARLVEVAPCRRIMCEYFALQFTTPP
jgi:[ribosomal protein S5]-alanine N-acetyltransferase